MSEAVGEGGAGDEANDDPMTFAALRARCDAALDRALPPADTEPARLHAAMRYAAQGGKRLRALIVYAAGHAAGAAPAQLDAPAAAVELVHAYSLVHDDLPAMDDDDLRRGRATVHKAYDEATAILAGDGLHTLAFAVLADPAFDAPSVEARLAWVAALSAGTGALGMTGGQALDLAAEGRQLALPDLRRLHALKTGALITAAVRMGLAAGQADAATVTAALRYAEAFGLAYQVQDDVLDVEGSAASLGKTPGKDAQAGKSTYVAALGLEGAKAEAARGFAEAEVALAVLNERGELLRALLRQVRDRRS